MVRAFALIVGMGLVIAGVALAVVGFNWPDPSRVGIINTPGGGYLVGGPFVVILGWAVIGFALKDIEGLNWIGGCFLYAFLGPVSLSMYAFVLMIWAVVSAARGAWALAAGLVGITAAAAYFLFSPRIFKIIFRKRKG